MKGKIGWFASTRTSNPRRRFNRVFSLGIATIGAIAGFIGRVEHEAGNPSYVAIDLIGLSLMLLGAVLYFRGEFARKPL
jgi:hypothetical protein